ncbi:MAG TPA: ATP:cob(I)alamin adenosyltransferase, partial [Candidatus Latescibacteria bacterium]|nr:ATP:cob(I)alamin adenosyltransferase [Candidatus Latescibacterota bacterium]
MARLYTRSGDGGRTRLADGSAVPKDDVRVEACGTAEPSASLVLPPSPDRV